jgi:hypothetical protein
MAVPSPPWDLDAIGRHGYRSAFFPHAGAMDHGEESVRTQRPPMWLSAAKPTLYAS